MLRLHAYAMHCRNASGASRIAGPLLVRVIGLSIGMIAAGMAFAQSNPSPDCDVAGVEKPRATSASSDANMKFQDQNTFDILNHIADSCPCESEVPVAVRDRIGRLHAAIARQHWQPWVGEYSMRFGPFVGMTVLLAPDGEFVMRQDGDSGYIGANHGHASMARPGILHFRFALPKSEGYGDYPDQLAFVHWGDRRYLIAPRAFERFVDAVNEGREPAISSGGDFLLAEGDVARHVAGMPPIPVEYARQIRHDSTETSAAFVPAEANHRIDEEQARERVLACDRRRETVPASYPR